MIICIEICTTDNNERKGIDNSHWSTIGQLKHGRLEHETFDLPFIHLHHFFTITDILILVLQKINITNNKYKMRALTASFAQQY